jgi:hypothetical protein
MAAPWIDLANHQIQSAVAVPMNRDSAGALQKLRNQPLLFRNLHRLRPSLRVEFIEQPT